MQLLLRSPILIVIMLAETHTWSTVGKQERRT